MIVVDNYEQVLGAADRLGDLGARLPSLKLLVTSREPLHLALENEYPVHPFRESDAIVFFTERARAVKPDFQEDAERSRGLQAPGLPAASSRAGRRADESSLDRELASPIGATPTPPDGRSPRRPGTPTDFARSHQLELRVARRRGAGRVQAPRGLRG